jgi:endogenous inhibitor of DNA gyrase (YacG/DUF329 family)
VVQAVHQDGLKFNCSNTACRARIEVADALAGTELPCPQCGTALHVPQSHDIRFVCTTPECEQHLVADVSEAGRFVKCPACGKPKRIPGESPNLSGGSSRLPPRFFEACFDALAPTTSLCRLFGAFPPW